MGTLYEQQANLSDFLEYQRQFKTCLSPVAALKSPLGEIKHLFLLD